MTDHRLKAGKLIFDAEARKDGEGNLAVYRLPKNDGGGSYEIAGINNRFHPEMALKLANMIAREQFAEAEAEAIEYILQYTDKTAAPFTDPGVAYLMRDIAFNRGPTGANRMLKMVVGNPLPSYDIINRIPRVIIVPDLTAARERYERNQVGIRPNLIVGLRRRWRKARDEALNF